MKQPVVTIVGCGWLGEPLGAAMVALGWHVRGTTTSEEKLAGLEAQGIEAHLLNLDPHLETADPERVFDCDAFVLNIPPGRKRPDVKERFAAQIDALIPWLQRDRIRQVVFASSTSVYAADAGDVTEETPPSPDTASGEAVLHAEESLKGAVGPKLTIVRLAGLIGGSRYPARFLAGKEDVQGGDLPVNLIGRTDALGIFRELLTREIAGETLNACCPEHPTRREFYCGEAEKMGVQPPTFLPHSGSVGKRVLCPRLEEVLGYRFQVPNPSLIFPEGE